MPTYDYNCSKCGHEFEESYKISERHIPEEEPCPNCKKRGIKLALSTPALCSPSAMGKQKPRGDFLERMAQIKECHKYVRSRKGNFK